MEVTYRVPGAVLTEREHSVPLDHSKPDGEKITIFTRELAAPDGLDRPYTIADGEPVPYNDCLREGREAEGAVQ